MLSCRSLVVQDGHPKPLLPSLPTHCLSAGSRSPPLPPPRLCPLKQGLLRLVCVCGEGECPGLLSHLPEHQWPLLKPGIKMQAWLLPALPPCPSTAAAPFLCLGILGEEREVKGQVCLMAVAAVSHCPMLPSSSILMLTLPRAGCGTLHGSILLQKKWQEVLVRPWPLGPSPPYPALAPKPQLWDAPPAAAPPQECETCCEQCKSTSSCWGSIPRVFQLSCSCCRGSWGQGQILALPSFSLTRLAHLGMLTHHSAPLWPWG